MTPPVFNGSPLAVPFAGSDEGKDIARKLIEDTGCVPLDAGDLSQARHLEAMAIVVVRLLFGGYDPASPSHRGEPTDITARAGSGVPDP
jgi:hypothetical protein